MAKNKDTMTSNRTGILDLEELKIIKVDEKNGGETVYSIKDMLLKYNGHNVSLTITVDNEAPVEEE